MNKIKYYLCIMIGVMLALSACIKENMDDCHLGTRIIFSYDEADMGATPKDELDLENAILYVFDSSNRFVNSYKIENPQLDEFYDNLISLIPGDYSFVVWFNPVAPYAITPPNPVRGQTLKSDAHFLLQIPSTSGKIINQPATHFPFVLYGQKEETIQDNEENVVMIPVYENTNRINITLRGLHRTADTYRFSITDDNGIYTFDNEFAPCDPFSYVTHAQYPSMEETLSASLTVLQLADNRSPVLSIDNTNTGENIFPGMIGINNNLIEIIRSFYQGDFRKKHLYDIDIEFKEEGLEVWINGWELVPFNGELSPW